MVDCHMHMILDGVFWRDAIARHEQAVDRPWIRAVLERYRHDGYTYLRDGGDRWGTGAAAREMAEELGIRYRTPLAPLCKKGHYGAFIGRTYETWREYEALVREQKAQGADFIKIMISGLMDFDRFGVLTEPGQDPGEIALAIEIAHDNGFSVMAHCNGAETARAAAAAGVDSIEHGAYLDAEALAAMAETGCVWVPTLSTIGNLRGTGRFSEADVAKIFDSAAANVQAFASLGGLIAPGSDAGAWAVPHGANTELDLLQQALGERFPVVELGAARIMEKF